MAARSAVIFLPNDTARTGAAVPTMLQSVLGAPLLSWLSASLEEAGIARCFLLCHSRFSGQARACFPDSMEVRCAAGGDVSDRLHVFLSTAGDGEEDVLVITGPVFCIPGDLPLPEPLRREEPGAVYGVSRATFMSVLDEKFSIMDFLSRHGRPCGGVEGFFPVSGPEDLAAWQPVLKALTLRRLTARGVTVFDAANCYVSPFVEVGAGTALLPGVILQGRTRIGENCTIGPNSLLSDAVIGDGATVNASQVYDSTVGAGSTVGPFSYVRPGSRIGSGCRVGDFVEVKNSVIGDGTKVAHLTYVGDSDVGERVNFGCGTVTVNYDRAKKYRTAIEDDAFIGCNANLIAPVTVGRGAYIAAGSTITEDVPPQALGIARARQNNKKEWATRHKLKDKEQER